ncbi:MAG: SET domain-containing protein-lysine N-methyltransferase [Candidatus Vogelbacteria bacterium]|nr:SET domain-containing protein-lysine N-methyltransferase [Candidatus Vogelbacteria bacterium]
MENEKKIELFNQKNVTSRRSEKGYGFSYFAKKDFKPGDVVMMGIGKTIDHQTYHISVQIDVKKHYIPKKWTGKYWNHSCDPNTYVKTRSDGFPNLIANKKINKGDEITYSYWMSELFWIKQADESHVKCRCGSKKCKHKILSFSQLSEIDKKNVRNSHKCSRYLLKRGVDNLTRHLKI